MLTDNVLVEEKDEEEIETNNDKHEKTKEKGIKTNDKAKRSIKRKKNLQQKA